MRNTLIFLLVSLLCSCCAPSNHNFQDKNSEEEIIQEVEKIILKELPKKRSISAAIVKGDEVIWSRAYGSADLKTKRADTATIYRIGSISKPITAFLMMLLVQDSTIRLNDPVELYFPEIKGLNGYSEVNKITFEQLATHTSGLTREPALLNAASGPIEEWENKILESIPTTSFEFSPGEKFNYSNIGYGILGLALSRAAKTPFIELVEKRIFKPLKMNSSYYVVPQKAIPNLSAGIEQRDAKTPQREHRGRRYKVPNGGVYTTPNDLAKFMMVLQGGAPRLLSDENRAMMQDKIVRRGTQGYYGIGFFIDQKGESTIVNHGGAVSGYTANFAFAKESGYGVIFLRNYAQGDPDIWALSFSLLEALGKVQD